MAYISKLTIGGTTYDIYDAEARQILSQVLVFVGVTSVQIIDGALTPNTYGGLTGITIPSGHSAGDTVDTGTVVIYSSQEFVWDGAKWAEFGTTSSWTPSLDKDSVLGADTTFTPSTTSTNTGAGTSHSHTMGGTSKYLGQSVTKSNMTTATQSATVQSSVALGTLSTTSTSNGDGVVASLDTANLVTASVTPAAVGTSVTVVTGMASNPYYAKVSSNSDGANTNTITFTPITPTTAPITPAKAGTAFTYATGALSSNGSGSAVAYSGTTKYLELGTQSVTVQGTVATGQLQSGASGAAVATDVSVITSTSGTYAVITALNANTGSESAHTHTYDKTSSITVGANDLVDAVTNVTLNNT